MNESFMAVIADGPKSKSKIMAALNIDEVTYKATLTHLKADGKVKVSRGRGGVVSVAA